MKRFWLVIHVAVMAFTFLILSGAARAQETTIGEGLSRIGEAFTSPESLYLLLVVPIVQVLKGLGFIAAILNGLGAFRVAGVKLLSVIVGGALGLFGELVGIIDLGWGGALLFGLGAGALGTGLKELIKGAGSGRTPTSGASLPR